MLYHFKIVKNVFFFFKIFNINYSFLSSSLTARVDNSRVHLQTNLLGAISTDCSLTCSKCFYASLSLSPFSIASRSLGSAQLDRKWTNALLDTHILVSHSAADARIAASECGMWMYFIYLPKYFNDNC